MAILAYIRQIAADTFLHCTHKGQATCLRNYSRGPLVPPTEIRNYTHSQIQHLLTLPGNRYQCAPYEPWKRTEFWHETVADLNAQYGLPGSGSSTVPPGRLLDLFQSQVGPLHSARDAADLQRMLEGWGRRLAAIVEKASEFNHWDYDDATALINPRTGLGWTAALLEFSRAGGLLHHVQTGDPGLDFALIAMDLHLGISSRNNPFGAGLRDFIKPDGLAVRADGSLAVVEVKAEDDDEDLFRATIQALCGALAVHARRDMLTRIARCPAGRRPAVPGARLPAAEPSLGVYLLVSTRHYRRPAEPAFRERVLLLLQAFPALGEVAFFPVDPRTADFPNRLPADWVVNRSASVSR